jgi:hypothetical protein
MSRLPVSTLLSDCCAHGVRASVLAVDLDEVYHARFVRHEGGHVVLALLPDTGSTISLSPPVSCTVAFNWAGEAQVFVSSVVSFRPGPGQAELTLITPRNVASSEARLAFRAPLASSMNVEAVLHAAGQEPIVARVRDLSLSGMGVTLSHGAEPLGLGTSVRAEIAGLGEVVSVAGEVRRSSEASLGIMFEDVMKDGRLESPPALARLFETVEREWLAERWQGQLVHSDER